MSAFGVKRTSGETATRFEVTQIPIADIGPDSEQFRPAPRTCQRVGGRLRMRWTDCEGGSPRVRYTTARFYHPAWRRRVRVAARGARRDPEGRLPEQTRAHHRAG